MIQADDSDWPELDIAHWYLKWIDSLGLVALCRLSDQFEAWLPVQLVEDKPAFESWCRRSHMEGL
jgi:hypothetical protein